MANRYDDAVRALCALDLSGLCRWLGVPVDAGPLRRLSEAVPPATTRAVDLLLAVGTDLVVHVEFQANPEAGFGFRMLQYRVRLRAVPEFAGKRIIQHAVLLRPGTLEAGHHEDGLAFTYEVHALATVDPAQFLGDPSLAPFAVLGDVAHDARPAVLARALTLIAGVDDRAKRDILARVAVELAGIHLERVIIEQVWEETKMPIPSLLNDTYNEGLEAGRVQGLEAGRSAGLEQAARALLRARFGKDLRIDGLAHRLAQLGPDECMRRIELAEQITDLP